MVRWLANACNLQSWNTTNSSVTLTTTGNTTNITTPLYVTSGRIAGEATSERTSTAADTATTVTGQRLVTSVSTSNSSEATPIVPQIGLNEASIIAGVVVAAVVIVAVVVVLVLVCHRHRRKPPPVLPKPFELNPAAPSSESLSDIGGNEPAATPPSPAVRIILSFKYCN